MREVTLHYISPDVSSFDAYVNVLPANAAGSDRFLEIIEPQITIGMIVIFPRLSA
jgi:hypothetical protein